MPNRDWFTDAFGAAAKDIREKLVEEAWFGRAATRRAPGHEHDDVPMPQRLGWEQLDRVLHDKLTPDKIGDMEMLRALEAEHIASMPPPDLDHDR